MKNNTALRAFCDEIDALRAEIARLRQIEEIAIEFCVRCERGEIRSASTYQRFTAALGRGTNSLTPVKVRQRNESDGARPAS